MAYRQSPLKIGPATYRRLSEIKQRLSEEKQRQVTFSEVVDLLVGAWDAAGRQAGARKEAS